MGDIDWAKRLQKVIQSNWSEIRNALVLKDFMDKLIEKNVVTRDFWTGLQTKPITECQRKDEFLQVICRFDQEKFINFLETLDDPPRKTVLINKLSKVFEDNSVEEYEEKLPPINKVSARRVENRKGSSKEKTDIALGNRCLEQEISDISSGYLSVREKSPSGSGRFANHDTRSVEIEDDKPKSAQSGEYNNYPCPIDNEAKSSSQIREGGSKRTDSDSFTETKEYKQDRSEMEIKWLTTQAKNDSLKRKIKHLKEEIAQLMEDKIHLQNKLFQVETDNSQPKLVKMQLLKDEKDNTRLEKEKIHIEKKLAQEITNNSQLKNEKMQLEKKLEEEENKQSQIMHEKTQLEMKLIHVESERKQQSSTIQKLKEDNAKLEGDKKTLEREIMHLEIDKEKRECYYGRVERDIAKLESCKSQLESDIRKLKTEKDCQEREKTYFEYKVVGLESDKVKIENDNLELKRDNSDLECGMKPLKNDKMQHKNNEAHLQLVNAQLKVELEQKEKVILGLGNDKRKLEKEKKRLLYAYKGTPWKS